MRNRVFCGVFMAVYVVTFTNGITRKVKAVNEKQAFMIAKSLARIHKWTFNNQVRKAS